MEAELNEQNKIRCDKLAALKKQGSDPFAITKFEKTHLSSDILENFEKTEGSAVKLAGRILTRRIMGKASFAHILDGGGKLQIFVRADNLGEEYDKFLDLDIGDIIGVEGTVFKTKVGEISIKAEKIVLLSKALSQLPEKFHGLTDIDLRYRQRHLDLIVNPEVKRIFETRAKIISLIRKFLDDKGFLEVETPILNTIAGGAAAKPFKTFHNSLNLDLFMRIAPELYLKRLIVGGFEKVYELGRMFRNEGMSTRHNPEFTMMELYWAYADYNDMMDIVEDIIEFVRENLNLPEKISYQGTEISLKKPFKKLTMLEAVKKYTKLDFAKVKTAAGAAKLAKSLKVDLSKTPKTKGDILFKVFDELVEPKLINPTFITEYPIEISPLAKKIEKKPEFTYRFEFFVNGRELGNAYSELNDPIDQKERFNAQAKLRAAGSDEAHEADDDFIAALMQGMPPTGGLGIGIDRLIMLLTDSSSIRDVLFFPTMKPIK